MLRSSPRKLGRERVAELISAEALREEFPDITVFLEPRLELREVHEMKTQHDATGQDQLLAVLDGSTPCDALRSKAGRREIDLLWEDVAYHEARMSAGQRFDFSIFRREIGLENA